jgi:hypothetical protein
MRICAIGGAPGSGKTTLVREIMSLLQWAGYNTETRRYGLLDMIHLSCGIYVLGKYEEGNTFAGTDRLSMAVQPDAEKFVSYIAENPAANQHGIIFEGDRLCAPAFLTHCRSVATTRIVVLEPSPGVLEERRRGRSEAEGKDQNETWRRGRETKVKRIRSEFLAEVHVCDDRDQQVELAKDIIDWVRGLTNVEIKLPKPAKKLF